MTPDELTVAESLRVLVTGGRGYADAETMERVLNRIHGSKPIAVIIEGGAEGADRLARAWATWRSNGEMYYVDRSIDGPWPAAGPRRNSRMLADGKPDLGVAFPGGKGTADMVRKLTAAKIGIVFVDGAGKVSLRGPAVRLHRVFFGEDGRQL
jgi:hypothetical protein